MWLLGYFWHAEFISELKAELIPTVFEKNAENNIKISNYHYFFIFCDFSLKVSSRIA